MFKRTESAQCLSMKYAYRVTREQLNKYAYCDIAAQRLDWDNTKNVIKTNIKSIDLHSYGNEKRLLKGY